MFTRHGETRERWFEVFADSEQFDVITREMDEITNAIANGFAQLAARLWDGKVEDT